MEWEGSSNENTLETYRQNNLEAINFTIRSIDERVNSLKKNFEVFFYNVEQGIDVDLAIVETEFDRLSSELVCEKSQLIEHAMISWKNLQKEISIGCIAENDVNNEELKNLLELFNLIYTNFGLVIFQIRTWICNIIDCLQHKTYIQITTILLPKFHSFLNVLNQFIVDFMKESIIVSKQPPPIVTMFDSRSKQNEFSESQDHDAATNASLRRSRFWFDTELYILGKEWMIAQNIVIQEIRCEVILLTDNANGEQPYSIFPTNTPFKDDHHIVQFKDMRILKIDRRPRGVMQRRYAISYEIDMGPYGKFKKFSLPFAIVNGEPDAEKDTLLCIERGILDYVQQIRLQENCVNQEIDGSFATYHSETFKNIQNECISREKMIALLESRFRRISESKSKQKSIQRLFNRNDVMHILSILELPTPKHLAEKNIVCTCVQCKLRTTQQNPTNDIYIDTILKHIIALKYCAIDEQLCLIPCTFIEWFDKVAEMAGVLNQFWSSEPSMIYGFCDQTTSEALVVAQPGKILIRFADTMLGQFRLTMKDDKKCMRHITIKYSENLDQNVPDSFSDEKSFLNLVKETANQYGIFYIYNQKVPNLLIPGIEREEHCFDTVEDKHSSGYEENTYTLSGGTKRSGYEEHTYTLSEGKNRISFLKKIFSKK